MYIPEHFAERRPAQLCRIIRGNPLGILVAPGDSEIYGRIPFDPELLRRSLALLTRHHASSERRPRSPCLGHAGGKRIMTTAPLAALCPRPDAHPGTLQANQNRGTRPWNWN
ncbi:FMN-binding negative transcriptional regulator [Metapseudomonas boanensis]